MGFGVALCVGGVIGYLVGVLIERKGKSNRKLPLYRAHPGVRQQLARHTKPPRFRKW